MKHCNDFRKDLEVGKQGEEQIASILSMKEGDGIEVKRDLMAYKTGNMAIEYESRGKPSGIATTEAEYWAYIVEGSETVILVEVERLKSVARKYGRLVVGGDNNTSKLVLVPLNKVFKKI